MKKNLIPFVLASLCSLNVFSQVITLSQLATGLSTPIGIMNTGVAGDDRLFVTERLGKIKIFNRLTGAVNATPFLDITSRVLSSTNTGEERGLLGLAFHPQYETNGYFYVNYTRQTDSLRSIIARFSVCSIDPDSADPTSRQVLLQVTQPFSNHNGGELAFGPDGFLSIALGDGGSGGDPNNNAQNRSVLLGKILRIDVDAPSGGLPYGIPPDNPFVGNSNGWREEIFAYGLRNP